MRGRCSPRESGASGHEYSWRFNTPEGGLQSHGLQVENHGAVSAGPKGDVESDHSAQHGWRTTSRPCHVQRGPHIQLAHGVEYDVAGQRRQT